MNDLANVQEHQEVIGSDGGHVGTVDGVDGNRLKLTRNDSTDGQHHFVEAALVLSVNEKVHLRIPAEEARAAFTLL